MTGTRPLLPDPPKVLLRLYVAGNMPNSQRAIANLRAFCAEHLPTGTQIEILDVFELPERATADQVLLTPQLLAETPGGLRRVAGDLSDRSTMLNACILGPVATDVDSADSASPP